MSWANCSSVTRWGGSSAEWQSRQVFAACACATPALAERTSKRITLLGSLLFRHVAIDSHRDDIGEREYACAHNESPATATAPMIKEWKHDPEQSGSTEYDDAHDIAIQKPHLGRDLLKRLEHEHEIPFWPDASRGRPKRIRFCSQFPRQNGGECSENSESDVPCHQLAQKKAGEKFHLPHINRRGFPARFHARRDAHAEILNERQVNQDEQGSQPRQNRDVKSEEARKCCEI